MAHSTPPMANYAVFIKKTKPLFVVANQTEMLTTDIVKHQRVSHSGGTCVGGGMRCGPRCIFVWYTAADAAGNAYGLKPTKHDSNMASVTSHNPQPVLINLAIFLEIMFMS